MPKEFSRSERVGDAIQRELARVIRNEIRDPRVGMVSVNAVQVSKDLSNAKVFVTFIDNPENVELAERVAVLAKAAGFLRTSISHEIRMRSVPRLWFQFDETVYTALEISALIDQAIRSDKDNHHDDVQD